MNFIDSLATSVTRFIRANYNEAASESVLFYALCLLINTLFACTTALIISLFTEHFVEALMVICFYTLLRYFAGGLHLSTSLRCSMYSIIVFTTLAHISMSFSTFYIGVTCTIISALILLNTAPQGIKNMSKINEKYYPALKLCAVALVLANLYFQSGILCLTYFFVALQTTKPAYFVVKYIEKTIDHTLGKEVV